VEEECAADCPSEVLDAAVEVNSPFELDPAAALESPAVLDPPPVARLPTAAALALAAPWVAAGEDDVEDETPAKARSGPNSRLASSAGVKATADAALDRPDVRSSACASPESAPVSR